MALLLTGAAGFVGGHVLAKLPNDAEVISVGKNSRGKRIKNIDLAKSFEIDGDFSSVIHLAGKNHLQENETSAEYFESNLNTTVNVLEFCRKKNVERIVFASSLSVYGKQLRGTITEQVPAKPDSAYSLSKLFAEQKIELYSKLYGINYSILRYATIVGQGQEKTSPISIFIENCIKNQDIEIGKDSFRNFVFVKDVVAATIFALKIKGNDVFNVAAEKNVSLSEAANKIKALLKSDSKIVVEVPARDNFRIDITKAKRKLNFGKSTNFDKAIEEMLSVKHS